MNQHQDLIEVIRSRIEKNLHRHQGIEWAQVLNRINNNPEKILSLYEMEKTGGEPDVVGVDESTGEYLFYDCSIETPNGRRSLCYDRLALESRKENKPVNNVMDMAAKMGIELLTEAQYQELQKLGKFDTKTSSWLKTPDNVRTLGGAIYGDRRYNRVFIYHNGAESYYASRGFRGCLRV